MMKELEPTDADLKALREEIAASERRAEYERLKQDLHQITYKAANTPNEYEGAMRMPDTDQVLNTKQKENAFIEMLIKRLQGMLSFRPIIGNVIALLICALGLFYVFNEISLPFVKQNQIYFSVGLQILGAFQIIKSGSRSLLLPLLALIFGGIVSAHLAHHGQLLHFGKETF